MCVDCRAIVNLPQHEYKVTNMLVKCMCYVVKNKLQKQEGIALLKPLWLFFKTFRLSRDIFKIDRRGQETFLNQMVGPRI